MIPEPTFGSMSSNPFFSKDLLNDSNQGNQHPVVNFYNISRETKHLSLCETYKSLQKFSKELFAIRHKNVRRMKKTFEAFQEFYKSFNFV